MLKQSGGTGAAAVRHFVDKFEKLQGDQNQLEDALTSFGGQWDWLVATEPNQVVSQATPLMVTAPITTLQQQQIIQPQQQNNIHSSSPGSPKVKYHSILTGASKVLFISKYTSKIFFQFSLNQMLLIHRKPRKRSS